MPTVETVRGAVDTADLGTVYMHEHVFVISPEVIQNYPDEWGDEEERIADAVQDLNIVVATGCYTYQDVPFYFHYRGPALSEAIGMDLPDPMVDMFVGDITNGITDTGVKAGLLKCAIDHQGLTGGVERIMRAVAQTHRQTGCPITVHTHPGSQAGLQVKKIMTDEEGVRPERVVLGHSGD